KASSAPDPEKAGTKNHRPHPLDSRLRGNERSRRSRSRQTQDASEPLTRRSRVRTGTAMTAKKVVFQGEPGANSHLSSREVYPDYEAVPCATFEDAFAAISAGEVALAMIPIQNSPAAPAAALHHLLPPP